MVVPPHPTPRLVLVQPTLPPWPLENFVLNYCHFASTRKAGTFDEAILTVRKAAGAKALEYLVYRFRNVYIKSWRLENADEDGLPEEVVDFCFHQCTVEYYPQKSGGAASGLIQASWDFWDLSQNKAD